MAPGSRFSVADLIFGKQLLAFALLDEADRGESPAIRGPFMVCFGHAIKTLDLLARYRSGTAMRAVARDDVVRGAAELQAKGCEREVCAGCRGGSWAALEIFPSLTFADLNLGEPEAKV